MTKAPLILLLSTVRIFSQEPVLSNLQNGALALKYSQGPWEFQTPFN